jgi:primosomal replication protein N
MYFQNRVWLQGRIHGQPRLKDLSPSTKVLLFRLLVVESWRSKNGAPAQHRNLFNVELLGHQAEVISADLKDGMWVGVNGYLRHEKAGDREFFKIRVLDLSFQDITIMLMSLIQAGIKVHYLHSEVETLERVGILRDLLSEQREDPLRLLALVANSFRLIWQTKLLVDRGIVPETLPQAEDVKKVERRLVSERKKLSGPTK